MKFKLAYSIKTSNRRVTAEFQWHIAEAQKKVSCNQNSYQRKDWYEKNNITRYH
jgi:hypothetical protein